MIDKEGIENKYVIKLRGKIYIITLRGKIYIEYKIIINKLGITLDAFNSKRFQFDVLWKMVVAFLNQFKKGKHFNSKMKIWWHIIIQKYLLLKIQNY